jgi:hypothetical protein
MRTLLNRLASHRLATPALLAAGALGAVIVLRTLDPNKPGSVLPPCPFYALTGLFCPGCGSTRCLHALVYFDLAGALAMNPLLVISLPAVALLTLYGARLLPAMLEPLARQLCRPVAWGIVLVGYAVARNLPWHPFTWLAPG